MSAGAEELQSALRSIEPLMRATLGNFLRIPSVSGSEGIFTRAVAEFATQHGFEIDLWQAEAASLAPYPEAAPGHLPLAGRPTLVIRLPGTGGGKSLMFNAHADVVVAGDETAWTHSPWAGETVGDTFFGRGACDVKGPLVSALAAMLALAHPKLRPAGDVLLELVPGEEDRVGLGTLTSAVRGYRADASIILEPTERAPRCASRGGSRFVIDVRGLAVHGTVKWLGRDAIGGARRVLDALDRIEARWNDRAADPLFADYPLARPITVDSIHAGQWQGMVCDRATIAGYLELLPGDDPAEWSQKLRATLLAELSDPTDIAVNFVEHYHGHRLESRSALCAVAMQAHGRATHWRGFNSGCEAGLRPRLFGTPTLVWGPGSLDHAHAVDERIDFSDVCDVAAQFGRLAQAWCVDSRSVDARSVDREEMISP